MIRSGTDAALDALPLLAAIFAVAACCRRRPAAIRAMAATVYRKALAPPMAAAYVEEESDVLFTPIGRQRSLRPVPAAHAVAAGLSDASGLLRIDPFLRLPGPLLRRPYVSYWDRLPYACGVYGYC